MSKPGRQPYEVIRRAWHSDSHQPLRGSLIQEIFRLVNELHSTCTRRKKVWQENLPTVVLRAEEILYSEANSEGEYADVTTLKSRLDDALKMMIQRENGEGNGVHLVPCMEAALSLRGAFKRGTRGEQQGGSSHYLNAAKQVSFRNRPAMLADGNAVTVSMESTWMSQEYRHLNNTYAQALPMQEQDTCLVAHPPNSALLNPAAAFWSPTHLSAILIPQQHPMFHQPLEVSHLDEASSFPKPGALNQLLSITDSCSPSGLPNPGLLCSLPQVQLNLNQPPRPLELLGSAGNSEGIKGSISPCAGNHRWKPSCGASDSAPSIVVPKCHPSVARDKALNFDLKELLSLPGGEHGSSMSILRHLYNGHNTAISKQNSPGISCGVDDELSSHSGVHDLQLRLGPPVNKLIATPDDVPAPKRKRADVSDTTYID